MYLNIFLVIFVCLSVYLHLFIDLSIHAFACLFVYFFIYIYFMIHVFLYLLIYISYLSTKYVYIYTHTAHTVYICLFEGCSTVFKWKQASSEKNFCQTLANPMFIFNGTCCLTLAIKTLVCYIIKLVRSVYSPVRLHAVAVALKHLRLLQDVGPCSPPSASSDTSTPELSGLPPS